MATKPRGPLRSLGRWMVRGLLPNQRLKLTREGQVYLLIWVTLLAIGLQQQSNLILLTAGLAAGPLVASILLSASVLRKVQVTRRAPPHVFEGGVLPIDYGLQNQRKRTAALALTVDDEMQPVDRAIPGSKRLRPAVRFSRVAGASWGQLRWQAVAPVRGRYRFTTMDLVTRAPFGLMERRLSLPDASEIVVYPRVGQLTRRWMQKYRDSTETKRGKRYDRTVQEMEYHGLRDYRPSDSPRWIHWRTTARIGRPMVKEFEQQSEQDLAILMDPWLPRTRITPEQRETLEQAIRFAATVCLEACRRQGRRLTLGWTGPSPGVRQGPAGMKLLHETMEQLATMRPNTEGTLATLLDALPPQTLRQALILVVSTRSVNLLEESERSARLSSIMGRSLTGRVVVLDASRNDLDELIQFEPVAAGSAQAVAAGARTGNDTQASRGQPTAPATAG